MDTPVTDGCLCCGPGIGYTEHEVAEGMFRTGETFTYRECHRCGSLQISAVPPNLGAYYDNSEYYSFGQRRRRQDALLRSAAAAAVLRANAEVFVRTGLGRGPHWTRIGRMLPSHRILDLGCGGGQNLLRLSLLGYRHLTGADPFLDADRDLLPGVRLHKQRHEDIEGQFDRVMMHHVFEHVADPRGTLRSCRRILAVDGRVIIRLPIMGQAAWRTFGTDWVQIDPPRHLALYTLRAVREVAESEGFEVERVVFDSTEFQFWGSTLVSRAEPQAGGRKKFSTDELAGWRARAAQLNMALDGDQACLILRRRESAPT